MIDDNISYFQINHHNQMEFPTQHDENESKFKFVTKTNSLDELGNVINKYFSVLIPKNTNDTIDIVNDLISKKLKKQFYSQQKVEDHINKILQTDYSNGNFIFSTETIIELTVCLILIYEQFKKYGIKKYIDIKPKIEKELSKGTDIIKYYTTKVQNEPQNAFRMLDYRNQNINIPRRNKIQEHKYTNDSIHDTEIFSNPKDILSFIKSKQFSLEDEFYGHEHKYQYPKMNMEFKGKLEIPNEMLILVQKFNPIHKVTFVLDKITELQKYQQIICLLNMNWLFPNLDEIDLELANEELQTSTDNIMKLKLKNQIKTTKYDSGFISKLEWQPKEEIRESYIDDNSLTLTRRTTIKWSLPGSNKSKKNKEDNDDEEEGGFLIKKKKTFELGKRNPKTKEKNSNEDNIKEKDDVSIKEFAIKNKDSFEMVIIFSYFIAKLVKEMKFKTMSLYFQECFASEIVSALSFYKLTLVNFHFMNFFDKCHALSNLNIQFNSLSNTNFEKILSIINIMDKLRSLRLSFFSPENNYSPSSLLKLYQDPPKSVYNILDEFTKGKQRNKDQIDVDQFIIQKLLPEFEENMSCLFFIFTICKSSLYELSLLFDIPSIITNNDDYIMVLLKFIFNILIMLSFEEHILTKVRLIAPYLKFDNRAYPFIDEIFSVIELKDNNKTIQHFDFQVQLYNVPSIINIISPSMRSIFLGDLDMDTFISFVNYYTSNDFIQHSMLSEVKISLNNNVVVYRDIKDYVIKYLLTKPKELQLQKLYTYMAVQKEELVKELIEVVFIRNTVHNVYVEISKSDTLILEDELLNFEDKMMSIKKSMFNVIAMKYRKLKHVNIISRLKKYFNCGFDRKCITTKQ